MPQLHVFLYLHWNLSKKKKYKQNVTSNFRIYVISARSFSLIIVEEDRQLLKIK